MAACLESARELRAATDAALDSERRMRLAPHAGNMFVWEVDLVTGRTLVQGDVKQVVGFHHDTAPRKPAPTTKSCG